MTLPLLDVFNPPLGQINNAVSAASRFAKVGMDNSLANQIENALDATTGLKSWLGAMPSKTPAGIAKYQNQFAICDLAAVANDLTSFGVNLTVGQQLFHGGFWAQSSPFTTAKVLSTSLCPQVALRNAEFKAKAYDAGRVDLWVLRVAGPDVKAFVFKHRGTRLGHEKEVLIATGVKLTLVTDTFIRADYLVSKVNHPDKLVPIHVLEIDIQ